MVTTIHNDVNPRYNSLYDWLRNGITSYAVVICCEQLCVINKQNYWIHEMRNQKSSCDEYIKELNRW